MWVRIEKDTDFWPTPRRMVSYKANTERSVTRAHGLRLIEMEAATEIKAPKRKKEATTEIEPEGEQ